MTLQDFLNTVPFILLAILVGTLLFEYITSHRAKRISERKRLRRKKKDVQKRR